jgi:hypothetical protein
VNGLFRLCARNKQPHICTVRRGFRLEAEEEEKGEGEEDEEEEEEEEVMVVVVSFVILDSQ